MSEGQLQMRRIPSSPPAPAAREAQARWQLTASHSDATAYDELWYQGRPRRP
jgi:hypothetical protein